MASPGSGELGELGEAGGGWGAQASWQSLYLIHSWLKLLSTSPYHTHPKLVSITMRNSHESANHPDRYVVHSSPLHHGIALWPPPSTDPKDPLRWPYWAKIVSLCAVALCNFTANFAGAGFAVTTPVLQAQFHKSAAQVNTLLTVSYSMACPYCSDLVHPVQLLAPGHR